MLTRAQEKLIRSLHTAKGRKETGLCLIEGDKVIETAKESIDFTFTANDTNIFKELVTTHTPQWRAAVARMPVWSKSDLERMPTVVVLDGVQDPGNAGAIFRLCLGFKASLVLVDSVDPGNSKTIRSSAGALFHVPWISISRKLSESFLDSLNRPVYRLELRPGSIIGTNEKIATLPKNITLLVGSEGRGITLPAQGISIAIPHDSKLESLNVGNATAIFLSSRYQAF